MLSKRVINQAQSMEKLLFLLLALISTFLLRLGSLSLLSPDTTRTPTTKRRSQREVDVLLRVETNDERWYVDDLLADTTQKLALRH